jgi:hypothetical protein
MVPTASSDRAALRLGDGLRPIVLGNAAPTGTMVGAGRADARPDLILSIHSRDGEGLGYAVVDRSSPGPAWGSASVSGGCSVTEACHLARATTLQLDLYGLRRGAHHCLVNAVAGEANGSPVAGFLDTVEPLTQAGIIQIVSPYVDEGVADLAAKGLAASATAVVLVVLEHLGIDPSSASVASFRPGSAGRPVMDELVRHGVHHVTRGRAALVTEVDVLIVGAPLWSLGMSTAMTLRARAVVALAPVLATLASQQKLHERRVLFVPEALAAGGRYVALELHDHDHDIDETAAAARTFALAGERCREMLRTATRRREMLAATIRAALS